MLLTISSSAHGFQSLLSIDAELPIALSEENNHSCDTGASALYEAILQMELLGHDFFIYKDVEDNTTNVIYRREDGDIGLLEVKEK